MFDIVGIGLGPFNLSLASLLKNKECHLKSVFFEKKNDFVWHKGMLMPETTLQVPFLADLVTMVDPTSQYSFLQYLYAKKRLFQFYFKESFFIPRVEYNDYCQWVCNQLDNLNFNHNVEKVIPSRNGFEVIVKHNNKNTSYQCKNIVVGIGSVPQVPECTKHIIQSTSKNCFHSSEFMNYFDDLLSKKDKKVVIVGSGQSAGEIFYRLIHSGFDNISWVTDDAGFFPMEYTPLALEHFSPDYMDFFYNLPNDLKDVLLKKQSFLYKGMNASLLKNIYHILYQKILLENNNNIKLNANSNLTNVSEEKGKLLCNFTHNYTKNSLKIEADYVILATGYRQKSLDFLSDLEPFIKKYECGRYQINRDYEVGYECPYGVGRIFVQNMEIFTHGVGTPDLGLGAYRASTIINNIANQEIYHLSKSNIFSTF